MLPLHLGTPSGRPLSVLAVGAHPDDIEIGAGGTLLDLAESRPGLQVQYVVLTGTGERQPRPATRRTPSSRRRGLTIDLHDLPEGRLPAVVGRSEGHSRGSGAVLLARPHHRAVGRGRAPGPPDHR